MCCFMTLITSSETENTHPPHTLSSITAADITTRGPLWPRRCPLQVYAFCLPAFVHASARKTQTRMNACRQAHTHTNYMACGFKAPLQEAATVCGLWRLEAELLLQSLVPCGVQADGATSALLIL